MRNVVLWVVCLLFVSAVASAEGRFFPAPKDGVKDLYIVILEDNVARKPQGPPDSFPAVAEVAHDLAARFGGRVDRVWEHVLQGFTVRMTEGRARALAEDGAVASVSQDISIENPFSAAVDDCYVQYDVPPGTGYSIDSRTLPLLSPQSISCSDPDPQSSATCIDNWGIDRINQSSVGRDGVYSFANRAIGVHVYVFDTGIRATHREFYDRLNQSRVVGGVNATVGPSDPARYNTSDCYGHGTHVAGILGGRTYGVAKDAILHSVRVLRCATDSVSTNTQVSWWIDGLEWIVANHDPSEEGTAVVSWSGANGFNYANSAFEPYASFRTAVHNLAAVPTLMLVQAAGNNSTATTTVDACNYSFGDEARYAGDPTTYDAVSRILIAGGSDENDGRWTRRPGDPRYSINCTASGGCGSNIGSCIDLFAPAAHVISASHKHDAGYCRLSGTSMAAPHVSGAAALYLQRNRRKTSIQVKSTLTGSATIGALQTSGTNSIGAGSPNLLLSSNVPTSACGADRSYTTRVNTSFFFYASALRGTSCLAGDFAYSNFDTQYGSVSIAGIAPEDVVYYYTPAPGFTGVDTFTYRVFDSVGLVKAMGLVKVTVTN
jgi:subtilisin family serine protease